MRAISSTSQRAITPSPGGKPGQTGVGIVCMLPPGDGVIGLRQVDEMALRPPGAELARDNCRSRRPEGSTPPAGFAGYTLH